jgi:hypothetical protein
LLRVGVKACPECGYQYRPASSSAADDNTTTISGEQVAATSAIGLGIGYKKQASNEEVISDAHSLKCNTSVI